MKARWVFFSGCWVLSVLINLLFVRMMGWLGVLPGIVVAFAVIMRLWEYGEFDNE